MGSYTFWESGDTMGVDVPAPRDGVAVGFAVVVALFCIAVLALMYYVVAQSEQSIPHADRAVIACVLLLTADVVVLAWLLRGQVLVVTPHSISLGTRTAGIRLATRLSREGATVSADGNGIVRVVSGGSSLSLVGLSPDDAARVAARVEAALSAPLEPSARIRLQER